MKLIRTRIAIRPRSFAFRFVAGSLATLAVGAAWAHHPLGGAVPATLAEGFLSGLGHPVIELDHLLFLLGAAVAAVVARLSGKQAVAVLAAYAVAGAVGTLVRVQGTALPLAEAAVGTSLLLVALWLWTRDQPSTGAALSWGSAAGFVHGFAYGEAVIGAETMPIATYLAGLVLVQTGLLVAAYAVARRLSDDAPHRLRAMHRPLGALFGAFGLWHVWSRALLA